MAESICSGPRDDEWNPRLVERGACRTVVARRRRAASGTENDNYQGMASINSSAKSREKREHLRHMQDLSRAALELYSLHRRQTKRTTEQAQYNASAELSPVINAVGAIFVGTLSERPIHI
ncbi:hypothetical protein J6590_051871 [Homalodisca vitripennis]|nr:hypothetical protein J6590_051871 [Homalodisca vitripennis]